MLLWVIFTLLDPDPDPLTRLNPDPIQIRIRIRSPGFEGWIRRKNFSPIVFGKKKY